MDKDHRQHPASIYSIRGSDYASCIKIARIPILPPLVTDERRKELVTWRQKAIEVEMKLKYCRSKKGRMSSSAEPIDTSSGSSSSGVFTGSVDSFPSNGKRGSSQTTESCSRNINLVPSNFNDEIESDIGRKERLSVRNDQNTSPVTQDKFCESESCFDSSAVSTIVSAGDESVLQILPDSADKRDERLDDVIADIYGKKDRRTNLNLSPCKDLVLKSNIFLPIINSAKITIRGEGNYADSPGLSQNLSISNPSPSGGHLTNVEHQQTVEKNDDESNKHHDVNNSNNERDECISPPKLVRQNSYTLDSPSPELVEFFKKQKKDSNVKSPGALKRMHTLTVSSEDEDKNRGTVIKPTTMTHFKPFQNNINKIGSSSTTKKARKSWDVEQAKYDWKNRKENVELKCLKKMRRVERASSPVPTTTDVRSRPLSESNRFARSTDCVFPKSNNESFKNFLRHSTPVPVDNAGENNDKMISSPKCERRFQAYDLEHGLKNLLKLDIRNNNSENSTTVTLTPEKDTSNYDDAFSNYSSSVHGADNTSVASRNEEDVSNYSGVSLNRFMNTRTTDNEQNLEYNNLRSKHMRQIEALLRHQAEELKNFSCGFSTTGGSVSPQPKLSITPQKSPPNEIRSPRQSSSVKSSPPIITGIYSKETSPKQFPVIPSVLPPDENCSLRQSSSVKSSPPIVTGIYSKETSPEQFPVTLSAPPTRLSAELIPTCRTKSKCTKWLNFNQSAATNKMNIPRRYTENEKRAGVIISAYVKGYLVRRLFKTERVHQLKQSIVDSLLFAKCLDNESELTPSDVELYSRLLNQVETAVHELQDIFGFPSANQMAIIRADREKKKLLRRIGARPSLSAATQRVLMRKRQTSNHVSTKSATTGKSKLAQRQRRKSFTGFSFNTSSNDTQRRHQQSSSSQLEKSASSCSAFRQPWK